jgi:hypothetical protein
MEILELENIMYEKNPFKENESTQNTTEKRITELKGVSIDIQVQPRGKIYKKEIMNREARITYEVKSSKSICLSICLSIYLSIIYLSTTYLSIYHIYLSSIYLSKHMYIYEYIYLNWSHRRKRDNGAERYIQKNND